MSIQIIKNKKNIGYCNGVFLAFSIYFHVLYMFVHIIRIGRKNIIFMRNVDAKVENYEKNLR